jgi:hypothetical protein
VGATASYDGLHLAPAWGDAYEYMGVRSLKYNGKSYDVKVNRNASCTLTALDGVMDLTLHYTPARFGDMTYTVTVTAADGTTASSTVTPDENGVIHVELKQEGVASVTIAPVIG